MANFLRQLNGDTADMLDRAWPALVRVASGRRGVGSGIIWDSNGLIITNAHVIRRSKPLIVFGDDTSQSAEVVGVDRRNDLAALRVDAQNLPAIEVGDSQGLRSGQIVMAMGHPWGVTGAVTSGIVVGSGHHLEGMPGGDRELIAVSLHLRPGFSGGPLLDDQGRLVGVNVMMAGPEVGLAIPAHVVEAFIKALGGHKVESRWTFPDPIRESPRA